MFAPGQLEVIARLSEDGDVFHLDHDAPGYTRALTQYEVDEWESSNYSDAVYEGTMTEDEDDPFNNPLTWVVCDDCGERIE